jgi:hypothetical protein
LRVRRRAATARPLLGCHQHLAAPWRRQLRVFLNRRAAPLPSAVHQGRGVHTNECGSCWGLWVGVGRRCLSVRNWPHCPARRVICLSVRQPGF